MDDQRFKEQCGFDLSHAMTLVVDGLPLLLLVSSGNLVMGAALASSRDVIPHPDLTVSWSGEKVDALTVDVQELCSWGRSFIQ